MALTRVDFPWATWPIVPMLIVACREMISGFSGVIELMSKLSRVCWDSWAWLSTCDCWLAMISSLERRLGTYGSFAAVCAEVAVDCDTESAFGVLATSTILLMLY